MTAVFVSLVLLGIAIVLALNFLPWWVCLLILAAGLLGIRYGIPLLFKRALMTPFKLKGKVLKGAQIQVHQIVPAPTPTRRYDLETTDIAPTYADFNWYYLDVTIQPDATQVDDSAAFSLWEPGDLMLVEPGSTATDFGTNDDELCWIHDYRLYEGDRLVEDQAGKLAGTQRLQFHVGIQPTIRELTFRYYFEQFGRVEIPGAPALPG